MGFNSGFKGLNFKEFLFIDVVYINHSVRREWGTYSDTKKFTFSENYDLDGFYSIMAVTSFWHAQ